MTRIAALLLGCAIPFAAAGEALRIEVDQVDTRYVVSVDMSIAASAPAVRRLLTDYAHLAQLNDSILESRVVETFSANRHRVYTFAEVCVAVFCRDLQQFQDVEQRQDGDIFLTIVPEGSDFQSGYAHWRFEIGDSATRVLLDSKLEPAFWVPPVIGPLLIKHALRRETLESVEKLEALAVRE